MIDAELKDRLTAFRRDIHRHPEVGWTEFRTTSLLVTELEALGFDVTFGPAIHEASSRLGVPDAQVLEAHRRRAVGQGADPAHVEVMGEGFTGAVATFDTGRPGPTIGLRFDIDANDLVESTDPEHRPFAEGFASINHGAMHGCGHDAHAAIGLGVATLVSQRANELVGTIKLLFQPAEEGVRGAESMVLAGQLYDVDFFAAVHMKSQTPLGAVHPEAGGFLASTKFDATFTGSPSHAANAPEQGRNALLAAAAATVNLHAMPRHSGGKTRINVGTFHAGTGRNVIAAEATIQAEIRGETTPVHDDFYRQALDVINGAAQMHSVEADVTVTGRAITADSSPELTPWLTQAFDKVEAVTEILTEELDFYGSEDASFMMQRVQDNGGWASYIWVGSDKDFGHHTARFDIDEQALAISTEGLFNFVTQAQRLSDSHGGNTNS